MKTLVTIILVSSASIIGCGDSSGTNGALQELITSPSPSVNPTNPAPAQSAATDVVVEGRTSATSATTSTTAAVEPETISNVSATSSSVTAPVAATTTTTATVTTATPSVTSTGKLALVGTCKDPDLSKLATTESTTNCAGNLVWGTLDLTNLVPANIRQGVTIAGVVGTMTTTAEAHVDCTTNNQVGCVTTSTYRSGNLTNLIAGNIKNLVTIAGIQGTSVQEYHSDCSTDGQTGCASTNSFKAVDMTLLVAGNIKSGTTIAGVLGTVGAAPTASDIRRPVVINGVTGTNRTSCRLNDVVGEKCSYTNAGWEGIQVGRFRNPNTGVTWQHTGQGLTYAQAATACTNLNTAESVSYWRLPDIAEAIVGNLHEVAIVCSSRGDGNACTPASYPYFWTYTTTGPNKTAMPFTQTLGAVSLSATSLTVVSFCVH